VNLPRSTFNFTLGKGKIISEKSFLFFSIPPPDAPRVATDDGETEKSRKGMRKFVLGREEAKKRKDEHECFNDFTFALRTANVIFDFGAARLYVEKREHYTANEIFISFFPSPELVY
jgi:hypothetical protein